MKLLPDNRTKYALSKQQLDKENKRALKILGGISLLGGGVAGLGYKVAKKGLSRFQKLSKVEQKKAVRKGVGVPERKFTLYSGNTHNTPSEWFTDKKNYAIRYAIAGRLQGRKGLPKVSDEMKPYNQKWIDFANKGPDKGQLFKLTLNQKDMLKVSKQARTGISTRNEMFTRSTGNFNQRFHSEVPKSIADKRTEIPIKRLLRVKNTHSYYKNKPTLLR